MTLPLHITTMKYLQRKPTRIPKYDYSQNNYYFVTICAQSKACIFGETEELNRFGVIAQEEMEKISSHYSGVFVDKFVIMPNHVHGIFVIDREKNSKENISLSQIVGLYKSGVSRKIHAILPSLAVWQRSFHDRVIRNQKEYEMIWMYIETNPIRWKEDCFYEGVREGQDPPLPEEGV